jgi:hypothetical protein
MDQRETEDLKAGGDQGFGDWYDMRGLTRRFDKLLKQLDRIATASERIATVMENPHINSQVYLELTQHVAKLRTIGVKG